MNRRGFLSLLAPAAALIVAPELLIPRKTFFLPPVGGWGGELDVRSMIAKDMEDAWRHAMDHMYRKSFPVIVLNPTTYNIINDEFGPFELRPGAVHYVKNKLIPLEFT